MDASRSARRRVTLALLLGLFLAALDVLVVAPALPSVVADLGGLPLYPWVFAAYLLTSTVATPIFGRLSDDLGRKPVYLVGLGAFLLGSVLAGAAPGMPFLVAMRGLQGLGAGALLPVTLTIVGDLYPLEQRARMQGVFASVWGVASVVGAPLGGVLVEQVGWRSVFYLNLPFGLAAAAIVARALEEPVRERRRHDLDVAGALALSLGLAAVLVALQWAGRDGLDPAVLGVGLVGVLGMGGFALRERGAAEPLVDPALLRSRIFNAASAGGFLGFGALYSATAHVPLLVRGVQQGSPREAGVALVPLSVSWVIASIACGRLLMRVGYRALTTAGGVLIVGGSAGLASLGMDFTTLRLYGALSTLGLGMGLAMTSFVVAVQGAAPPGRLGIATSSIQFFRTLGGAFGVTVLGAVLLGALRAQGIDAGGLVAGEGPPGSPPALPPEARMAGLRRVFAAGTAFAAGALVAGAAMPGGDARELAEPSRR